MEILKHTKKLYIFINEDYPKEIHKQRKEFIKHIIKRAKDQIKEAKQNFTTIIDRNRDLNDNIILVGIGILGWEMSKIKE